MCITMSAFYSECGDDFDEYVRRIVGPMHAKERTVTNLWSGRRFKVHFRGEWREGKVIEWCQWKVNPGRHLTEWSVTLELIESEKEGVKDDSGCGDERDTVNETKAKDDDSSFLKLRVNRMNIKGGGTLQQEAKDSQLFSLEWLDAASPPVHLEQGVLVYKCPYCRAEEQVVAAHEQADMTKTGECPVCLEVQDCRVLGCGHKVCHSCWSSYLQAAMNIGAHLGHLDTNETEAERVRRAELFKTRLSSKEARTTNHFAELVEQVLSGEQQDLGRFWKELMVESVAILFYSDVKTVISQLSIDAIKIFLHVLGERKEELFVMLNGMHQGEMLEFVSSLSFYCCDVIAEHYRQAGRNRFALPWSQLALVHAKQARSRTLLAAAHVFLGSTQQSAGMLIEASRTYDGSLGLGSSAGDVWKYREELLREIEQWTGSSGKLTPGC